VLWRSSRWPCNYPNLATPYVNLARLLFYHVEPEVRASEYTYIAEDFGPRAPRCWPAYPWN